MNAFLRRTISCILLLNMAFAFAGCNAPMDTPQVVATTLPVYEFTSLLCEGTGITVGKLITENVSCLHDYTMQVWQMRMVEQAEMIVCSGAGLEDFLDDVLPKNTKTVDCSKSMDLHCADHHLEEDHHHEVDPHIWLSPKHAQTMVLNISTALRTKYPEHSNQITENARTLLSRLGHLEEYGQQQLSQLSCRELVTFHDGFAYFAECFDLTILKAIEEESGSEASAAELIELIGLVHDHDLPAIFTETNGGSSAAGIISAETGARIYSLDMAMSGGSYFDTMYRNIDIIKEALG